MRGLSVAERIAAKTDSSGGPEACWPWIGGKGGSGTATMQVASKSCSVRKIIWGVKR